MRLTDLPRSELQLGQRAWAVPHVTLHTGLQAWKQSGCGETEQLEVPGWENTFPPNVYGLVGLPDAASPSWRHWSVTRHWKNQRKSSAAIPSRVAAGQRGGVSGQRGRGKIPRGSWMSFSTVFGRRWLLKQFCLASSIGIRLAHIYQIRSPCTSLSTTPWSLC